MNLDELVFGITQNMVMSRHCDDLVIDLLNRERSNEDGKKKAYLSMYVTWRCRMPWIWKH